MARGGDCQKVVPGRWGETRKLFASALFAVFAFLLLNKHIFSIVINTYIYIYIYIYIYHIYIYIGSVPLEVGQRLGPSYIFAPD